EAELGAQVHAHLRRHVGIGGQLLEGVAGRHGEDGEEHEADPREHRDDDEEAPEQVLGHAVTRAPRAGWLPRPADDRSTPPDTSSGEPRSRSPSRSAPRGGYWRPRPRGGGTRRG